MRATYFVMIAAVCALVAMMALVAYTVGKVSPRSFRLSVALARLFSFSVEMESRARDINEGAPRAAGKGRACDDHPPSLP